MAGHENIDATARCQALLRKAVMSPEFLVQTKPTRRLKGQDEPHLLYQIHHYHVDSGS